MHFPVEIKTEEYSKKRKKAQTESESIEESLKKSSTSPVDSSSTTMTMVDNEKCCNMIAIWLINRQRPFLTAEDLELIEIFKYLNPESNQPLDLPNNKAFVPATAHYIDDYWVLHETITDFGLMSGRHEEAKIADRFFDVLKEYDIISKFHAVTLDSASNNDTFVWELTTKLREEMGIEWNSEYHRF
nr:2007_t:CDS:2 [Entrophospora candida]